MRLGKYVIFEKASAKSTPSKDQVITPVPGGRVSKVDLPNLFQEYISDYNVLTPQAAVNYVETIRKAYPFVQNLSLAINDLVQLSNTGHEVTFGPDTKPDLVQEMREILEEDAKNWMDGCASIDPIVNKILTQLYVGGAIANEWVPRRDLKGIDYIALIKPELIRFGMDKGTGRFIPYQLLKYRPLTPQDNGIDMNNMVKLNPLTFKYYAFGGDTEEPYGVPPLVSALEDLGIQKDMMKNIAYIVRQLGILGFIQLLMEKPAQQKDESPEKYGQRLTKLLTEAKTNMAEGTKEGLMVGYNGDHEYEFHQTSQNVSGVEGLFNINQNLLSNGLKYSNAFLGSAGGSETNITVIFTKMLSQLRNVQANVKADLEFGYALHLRLRGYKFKDLCVQFKPSTITDDLKIQQAEEYKIRNSRVLYADGIINLTGYANRHGFEKPDQEEPRAPIDPDGALAKEEANRVREEGKDKSDRNVRDKNKPVPKRKDGQNKPV